MKKPDDYRNPRNADIVREIRRFEAEYEALMERHLRGETTEKERLRMRYLECKMVALEQRMEQRRTQAYDMDRITIAKK